MGYKKDLEFLIGQMDQNMLVYIKREENMDKEFGLEMMEVLIKVSF